MNCPIPLSDYPHVLLAHGGGGKLMHDLINKMFTQVFANEFLLQGHDGVLLPSSSYTLAFTTDTFVVQPLFFRGGNIGRLSVFGTVNDLAMCGAEPKYLSVGFVLEEGLPMETLWQVVLALKEAADEAGVMIVTGDTKVVERGKGDGIFINTTGVGWVRHGDNIGPKKVEDGDQILISGELARHGMAIMAEREGLQFETTIESDAAPLHAPILSLLEQGVKVHCLRDATRGGVAGVLQEIAAAAKVHCQICEKSLVVPEQVRGACEILGFDPLYVANEGVFVAFVAKGEGEKAVELLREHKPCRYAAMAGEVLKDQPGLVSVRSELGTSRVLPVTRGELLPRIC